MIAKRYSLLIKIFHFKIIVYMTNLLHFSDYAVFEEVISIGLFQSRSWPTCIFLQPYFADHALGTEVYFTFL